MKNAWKVLVGVCVVVVGMYAYMTLPGDWERFGQSAADSPYNSLVEGFRAGQLSLKKDVPPGLAQLANPYDPVANEVYRFSPYKLQDLSYYKGRVYSYYGVTPALILFWPYTALTGQYLFHRHAVTIFCAIGFLISAALLTALWRRYFPEVSVWVVVACVLALGLASGVPAQLSQAGVYQVPYTCGYMLTMLALGAVWCGLHEPKRRWHWLATASVAYGLAVGARPNLLLGAVALLVPVAQAWRERRQVWAALAAATVPITLIGLGLMLYNELRFDSPWEFGERYVLNMERHLNGMHLISLRYLRLNFWLYFLQPGRWTARFPFVHIGPVPPAPAGNNLSIEYFGVLTNIPLTWLALAAPLAWRGRSGQTGSMLRGFVVATALVFGMCAFTLGLVWFSSFNYELDFLPALMLLAVIGVLGLERTLIDRPVWRRAVRCGWGVLLAFSVAFNLLVNADRYADAHVIQGDQLIGAGRQQEVIKQYERALQIEPDYGPAHNGLGQELLEAGKVPEAIVEFKEALRINPDDAKARNGLGIALEQTGSIEEAITQYEQAVRISPDYGEAQNNLGTVLSQTGKYEEAVEHFQQAIRINPNYAVAHNNLGIALAQTGELDEAIAQYEQALRIKPDYPAAHNSLANALARTGRIKEAIGHYEQALRIDPNLVESHYNLGFSLEKLGRTPEAVEHYQQALKLRPDFAPARNALARLQAGSFSQP